VAESIGWAATLVFTASYFCSRAQAIRRIQMVGAAMWLAYGLVLHAPPVIVANVLVLGAAAWTGRKQ
jgi:inner membrane protein